MFAGRISVSEHLPRKTYGAEAYGKTVWSWRPWLASSWWRFAVPNRAKRIVNPPAMEARGIRLQGEPGISRKTTAQGMPECSDCTCMLVCATLRTYCTRDRGCSKHPAFPAPSSLWADDLAKLGRTCRENAEVCSLVVPREGGGPSIPEPAMIETRERGVLDTRLRGYDNPVCDERIASFAMMRRLNESYAAFKFRTIRNKPSCE